ncbi:hypothetical protein ACVME5_000613 [Bradyrhizobium liaoningense]
MTFMSNLWGWLLMCRKGLATSARRMSGHSDCIDSQVTARNPDFMQVWLPVGCGSRPVINRRAAPPACDSRIVANVRAWRNSNSR